MAASKKDNVNAGRVEYLGDDREGKLAALNNATSRLIEPVGIASISIFAPESPSFMIEPLP